MSSISSNIVRWNSMLFHEYYIFSNLLTHANMDSSVIPNVGALGGTSAPEKSSPRINPLQLSYMLSFYKLCLLYSKDEDGDNHVCGCESSAGSKMRRSDFMCFDT